MGRRQQHSLLYRRFQGSFFFAPSFERQSSFVQMEKYVKKKNEFFLGGSEDGFLKRKNKEKKF